MQYARSGMFPDSSMYAVKNQNSFQIRESKETSKALNIYDKRYYQQNKKTHKTKKNKQIKKLKIIFLIKKGGNKRGKSKQGI